ncbi:MAG TPA: hypothetical protein VMX94_00055 [Armatimonadota bacterium]|nr:hypothetical protein [Armatimonadota bacterium]
MSEAQRSGHSRQEHGDNGSRPGAGSERSGVQEHNYDSITEKTEMKKLQYGWLGVMGLSFWFFLGFPFAHHNESYIWQVVLDKLGLIDFITVKMHPFPFGTRPLGQAVVWLVYKASGGSIYPQQIFNYLVAVAAWYILFLAAKEKRVLSLVSLVVGGTLFSGYLYLFHIHGVWYSPTLLLIAVWFLWYPEMLTDRKYLWTSVLAFAAALFHTSALLIHAAFSIGLLFERWKTLTRGQWILVGASTLLALALIRPLSAAVDPGWRMQYVLGLYSYRTTEINSLLSSVVFLLGLLTAASFNLGWRGRAAMIALAVFASVAAYKASIPLLIVWIFFCILKALFMRRWAIALALLAAFVIPLRVQSGSPTHAVFIIMICAFVTCLGSSGLEKRLAFVNNRTACAVGAVLLVSLIGLRTGLQLPVLSKLAYPLLAEKEKTFQLASIIDWMMSSGYRGYGIDFQRFAGGPSETPENAINRTHRPPTRATDLSPYLNVLRHGEPNPGDKLVVCFGSETVGNAREVYRVKGRYAGDAIVFLPTN